MFKIKFPTKRIFRIFHILRINGMALFCNLFMERPSYLTSRAAPRLTVQYHIISSYHITAPFIRSTGAPRCTTSRTYSNKMNFKNYDEN